MVLIGITGLMVAVVTVYFLRLFTTFDIFATFECIRTGQVHSNGTGAFERDRCIRTGQCEAPTFESVQACPFIRHIRECLDLAPKEKTESNSVFVACRFRRTPQPTGSNFRIA